MNEPLKLPNGVFTLIESAEATSGERVSFEIVLPPGRTGRRRISTRASMKRSPD